MFDNQAKTLEDIKKAQNIRVHEGIFHMDDMMCIALVKKLNPNIGIIRDRDNIPEDTTDIICDCYGGFFDHHFSDLNDIKKRPNGTSMASMGCLMQVVGEEIFGSNWKEIDEKYIAAFDAADLGLQDNFLSHNIGKLNPAYKRNEIESEQIEKAIDMCTTIIDSFISKEKEPKDIQKYLSDYFKEKGLAKSLDENFSEYFDETFGEKIKKEILNEDGSISYILAGLNETEAKQFLSNILDTEKRMSDVKKEIDTELKEVREEAIKQNKEFATFDVYPGAPSLFSDTPIKYVIFKQTGTDKYCISTVATEDKVEEGFPIPKIPFPKEFSGKAMVLEKEINVTIPKILDIINNSENPDLQKLSTEFSDLLNRPINIQSTEELTAFNQSLSTELENKKQLLDELNKRGLEFVHPGQFFVQAKDKESAVNFVVEILSNDKYVQKCAVEQINDYIDKNKLNPELKDIFREEGLTTTYIRTMSKAIKENFSSHDLSLLEKSKEGSHEISEEIFDCIKEKMPDKFIEEIIKNDLSPDSVKILLEDFKDNKSENHLREEMSLLKLTDKYMDLDFNEKEIRKQFNKEFLEISENLSSEIKDSELFNNLNKIKEKEQEGLSL